MTKIVTVNDESWVFINITPMVLKLCVKAPRGATVHTSNHYRVF